MDIHNQVALVTGGARRVGKAIAVALARAGAEVIVTYHTSADQARATVAEIEQSGGRAAAYACDQSDAASIDELFSALRRDFDHIDILVNNAAIMERKPVLDVTLDDWERVINTNLRGPFFIAQAAARWLIAARRPGVIINIADTAALKPWPGYITHTISKTGLVAMTETLALALAPQIRVNAIAPGPIIKPPDWTAERWQRTTDASVPLKRTGSIDDVTDVVLLCVRSEFMTGHTLVIDGGRTLK
ncbi:MAG: SDR family oxidoreductase [Chloroflexi bacterium]|nr:SDR family oxidoreductase [Chloroflexota bacterium]